MWYFYKSNAIRILLFKGDGSMKYPYLGEVIGSKPDKFTGISIHMFEPKKIEHLINPLYFWAKKVSDIKAEYYPAQRIHYLPESEVKAYIDGEEKVKLDIWSKDKKAVQYNAKVRSYICFFYSYILDALTKYKNVEVMLDEGRTYILRFYNTHNAIERILILYINPINPRLEKIDGYYKDNLIYRKDGSKYNTNLYKVTPYGFTEVHNNKSVLSKDKIKEIMLETNLKSRNINPTYKNKAAEKYNKVMNYIRQRVTQLDDKGIALEFRDLFIIDTHPSNINELFEKKSIIYFSNSIGTGPVEFNYLKLNDNKEVVYSHTVECTNEDSKLIRDIFKILSEKEWSYVQTTT